MFNRSFNSKEKEHGRSGTDNINEPPNSRLFVVGVKENTEEEVYEVFNKFGKVDYVNIMKDKVSGDNKGFAYVKYFKTSDAAKAQEELNGKRYGKLQKTLKVVVAASKDEGKNDNEPDRYVRLFIQVPRNATEDDIREAFEKYGDIDYVSIPQDRNTGLGKGVAYVKFEKFYDAAIAFEKCPDKYKAKFAEPKKSKDADSNSSKNKSSSSDMDSFLKMRDSNDQKITALDVICSNTLTQDQLWRLFDIVPSLDYCQIIKEDGPRNNEVTVIYKTPEAALYAKEKIHGLEFPAGERIIVKFATSNHNLDSPMMDLSVGNNSSMCSVTLPAVAPMADSDAPVACRLFITSPSSIPLPVLKNVFSRFGDLIDLYLLNNKNCGYVKYASERSAQKAIDTLNGAEVYGSKMKVVIAEEPGESNRKRVRSS